MYNRVEDFFSLAPLPFFPLNSAFSSSFWGWVVGIIAPRDLLFDLERSLLLLRDFLCLCFELCFFFGVCSREAEEESSLGLLLLFLCFLCLPFLRSLELELSLLEDLDLFESLASSESTLICTGTFHIFFRTFVFLSCFVGSCTLLFL